VQHKNVHLRLICAALSGLAMSVPTILMVSWCPVPRFQSPHAVL